VGVTDVRPHGQRDRILGERLRRGRSPDAATVPLAGAGSNGLGLPRRGPREQLEDSPGESLAVLPLRRLALDPPLLALDLPPGFVRSVLALRLLDGGPFHQDSLPLIALAGSGEFEDHGAA
jgi:hypothetical protein